MQFPMHFEVKGESPSGIQTLWSMEVDHLPAISCAIPPEFRGPGGGYSPEDLLGLAALSCLIATFKVYAQMSQLSFESISGNATVTVDRLEKKPAAITKMHLALKVSQASNREKALQLLEESKKTCLVTSIVNVEKTYHFDVIP
jgi:organic hydroperoxide reductase OsmC/OhrA